MAALILAFGILTSGTRSATGSGQETFSDLSASAQSDRSVSSGVKARPVVIDTDMSVDDWMAILFLLHRSDVSVKAITVAGTGAAHGAAGARNAIRLLDLEGRRDIPVAYGRATTYPGGHAFPASWRPALDDMLGIDLPKPSRSVSRLPAAKLIAKVAAKSRVQILELGPPTNVADALRAAPGLKKRVSSVTLMSGAVNVAGNAPGEKADWNFYVDPGAAKIVLRSGIPWTLVPLDATNAVPYNEPFFSRLEAMQKTAAARFVYQALSRQMPGEGLYFWDPLAAAVLVDPSVATLGQRTIRVVTTGAEAGRTLTDANGTPGNVALAGHQQHFETLFLTALNRPTVASTKNVPKSRWLNKGPEGGMLAAVTTHPKRPQVVYASSSNGFFGGGFFRSTDGAASWTRRSAPPGLENIALDPEDTQTVYAIAGASVYRTTDGGASWRGLLGGMVGCPGKCPTLALVAVSLAPPHLIYAVSGTRWGPQVEPVRLWSSADKGQTWTQAGTIDAAAGGEPAALLVDPAKPSTVYVWVSGKGVFRSEDGGAHWTLASAGLSVANLSSLAVDPKQSGVLYAGSRAGEVFRSGDLGTTWTQAAHGLDGAVTAIAVSAADRAVYAGTSPPDRTDRVEIRGGVVYRSADGQAPWRLGRDGLGGWHIADLAADPTHPGRVLAATEHGIYVSGNGGSSWAARVNGLVASNINGLAVDPSHPRVAFAAFERGIAVSRDGGKTWRLTFDLSGKHAEVGALLAVPGKPATIYAVKTAHTAPKAHSTLLRSRNGGRSWATVAALPASIRVLIADPSRPATLYALGGSLSPWFADGGSIYKSRDSGKSWRQIYSAKKPEARARTLAVDPHHPNILYAGLLAWNQPRSSPLLKSKDRGHTWRRLKGFGPGGIWALATDAHRNGMLYALAIRPNGLLTVKVSKNAGRTWTKLGDDLVNSQRNGVDPLSLLVDPIRPVVYAATSDGVYTKTPSNKQWRAAGLTETQVFWLAVDTKARRLYAGGMGSGVAATPLPLSTHAKR